MAKYKRICKFCGKPFETKFHNKVYCSPRCKSDNENTRKRVHPETADETKKTNDIKEDEKKVLLWLKNKPLSIGEISRRLDKSKETIIKLTDNLQNKGYDLKLDKSSKQFILEREFATAFKPLKLSTIFKRELTFGIVSDNHTGSKYQQMTILKTAYADFIQQKVAFVLHAGDITDGINMYRGQVSELFLHGADEQAEYIVEYYPKAPFKTYIISGNHDTSYKRAVGYNVVRHGICDKRNDLVFRGEESSEFDVKGLRIGILHPSGGVAYARSYRAQKIIESVVTDTINHVKDWQEKRAALPHIFIIGHYHISNYLPYYMGVATINAPCMQAQTPYLKRKGLSPELGYVIVKVVFSDMGIPIKITPDFVNCMPYIKEKDY